MSTILSLFQRLFNCSSKSLIQPLDYSIILPCDALNRYEIDDSKSDVDEEKPNYIAIAEYEQQLSDDTSLKKADPLLLIYKSYSSFYLIKNLRTKCIGFVPSNFIAPMNDLKSKEWYFPEIGRVEAERLLETYDNQKGVFIVRDSSTNLGNSWALSILDNTEDGRLKTIHYLIHKKGYYGYYIREKSVFSTIDELIEHYTQNEDGLCCKLLRSCHKEFAFFGFKDVWEEQPENITILEQIGKGNFGEVNRGIWRKKIEVAVKKVSLTGSEFQEALEECETMKNLKHDKIIKLFCVCTKNLPILIICEYMCNGSLLNYLRKGDGKYLKFKDIVEMATQIASGMKYMESINYVHKDLAARNILVGKNKIVKIGDFGLAKKLNENGKFYMDTDMFPIRWTAPEVYDVNINGKREYTTKSDVWSFGILLYELVTLGEEPYIGLNNEEVKRKVSNENYRLPKPPGLCTQPFYEKMLKCWNLFPAKRDTFESLYFFFNDYFISTEPSYHDPDTYGKTESY